MTAYNQGKVDPWLTAYLLGCIGDASGYETVRGILLLAPRFLAESYAGVALAKIRGSEALPDLANLVYEAPRRISREGAAWGLGELASVDAADIVFEAAIRNLR